MFKFLKNAYEKLVRFALIDLILVVKHTLQKIFRGFSDDECWNLDYTISKFVIPRLKHLKKVKHGSPRDLSEKSWNEKLDSMINAFMLILDEDDVNSEIYKLPVKKRIAEYKRIDKEIKVGLANFSKFFRNLWD